MKVCFFVPDSELVRAEQEETPLDAERLLRCLGLTGRLIGFQYAVYMVEQVLYLPEKIQLITKRLYPETARHFHTSSNAVERAIRTLVRTAWRQEDHQTLDCIAGTHLVQPPSNSEFIDMLAGFLRHAQSKE